MPDDLNRFADETPQISPIAKDVNSHTTEIIGDTVYLLSHKGRVTGAYQVDEYGVTIARSIAEARYWYESEKN